MTYSLGKKFEAKVKGDWETSLPDNTIIRLPDQQSRYYGQSRNICDYLGFAFSKLFMIECKETKENTFNFAKLTQYEDLLEYDNKLGTYPGVLLWFSKHDVVIWVNVRTIKQMKNDGKKSINIKDVLEDKYKFYIISTEKLRTFMKCDFNKFVEIEK